MKLSNFGIECASSIVRSWFLTISCSLWRVCPDSIIKDSKTLKSDLSPLKFLSSWALLDLNIPIVSSARCRRFLKLSSFMILLSILFRLMGGHKEYCAFTSDHLIYGISCLFRLNQYSLFHHRSLCDIWSNEYPVGSGWFHIVWPHWRCVA